MKLLINWDDNLAIIDGVEYKLDEFTIDPYNMNLKGYMINWPKDNFYIKGNIVLKHNYYDYYALFKLDEDGKIEKSWGLNENTN